MVIANPIFHEVFDHLLKDDRAIKFFMSMLIGKQVVEVKYLKNISKNKILVRQAQFLTSIKNQNSETKKLLVQIYLANDKINFFFDNKHFAQSEDSYETKIDTSDVKALSIYLLNFDVVDVEKLVTTFKPDFEHYIFNYIPLKHESIIIQLKRITHNFNSILDELLYIFKQDNFIDEYGLFKALELKSKHEEIYYLAEIFERAMNTKAKRKRIAKEREAYRTYREWMKDIRDKWGVVVKKMERKALERAEKLEAIVSQN